MTRRKSKREIETAISDVEELESDTGWREAYGLDPGAPRSAGWRAGLEGRGDREAWLRYLADGDGQVALAAREELEE